MKSLSVAAPRFFLPTDAHSHTHLGIPKRSNHSTVGRMVCGAAFLHQLHPILILISIRLSQFNIQFKCSIEFYLHCFFFLRLSAASSCTSTSIHLITLLSFAFCVHRQIFSLSALSKFSICTVRAFVLLPLLCLTAGGWRLPCAPNYTHT